MVSDTAIDPGSIEEQLRKIMTSLEFKVTARQKKFLKFVVEMTLKGKTTELKGYTIATKVFGRKVSFDQDQATDPVVSVEARRLRRGLEQYYLFAGNQDPVIIDIPKGGYVPIFQVRETSQSEYSAPDIERYNIETLGGWPTVLIRPFKVLSEDINSIFVAEGFTTELAIELSRYQDIRVLMKPSSEDGQHIKEPKARFLIDGSIRHGLHNIRLAVQLFDRKTGKQIWGDVYNCDLKTTDLFAFQEEVAQIISAMIAEQEGFIVKTLSLESRNKPPVEMETYEAIHKFYKFETTYTPESFYNALEALKQGCKVWCTYQYDVS